MYNTVHIVLPRWCWDKANSKDELKANIQYYIAPPRYYGYRVIEIGKYYARCEINR